MRKPYSLEAKDVSLSLSKDPYGPKEKQDLGKPKKHFSEHKIVFQLLFTLIWKPT